ncbi:hypothetical protein K505DRAFT_366344 [Melanomma pulvis-pyrius CBS 109.77]|uniref:Uncharacterized protein n=1 Tax=Melanomma pulvis-pyrius CBS 109.77 TaxID=1314802 RepID=A0A6A6WXH0_9PLEO|nr:hypothetical protein K505DRAFT_366344 [Melanomma pulvis-pyrius CBS 109.77]
MKSSTCLNDNSFGPVVEGCRDDFDFTIKFELIFFSLIPTSLFIVLAAVRISYLSQRPRIVGSVAFQVLKLAFIITYSALQLSRLVFLATASGDVVHMLSVASSAMAFVASLPMAALSFMEHGRSPRPSVILSSYLFLTTLLDIVQTRTLWLSITMHRQTVNTGLFTASLALKVLLLLLEAKKKTKWIHWTADEHSPEESSGILDLGLYIWLKQLFLRGYNGVLDMSHLYHLDEKMSSEYLHERLATCFNGDAPHGRFRLAKALAKALIWPLLLPAAPRIALIGFMFCQPFFISAILKNIPRAGEIGSNNDRYGLIGSAVLIYTGIALSRALYGYFSQRVVYMARGCLSAAIYKKTTESQITASDDAAAVTLMSTDIERIIRGFEGIHEVWANTLEAGLGCWLLQRKLRFAFLSPVIVILICAAAMVWVGNVAGKSQAAWMAKIQNRVGMTSRVIEHIKQVKISGIAGPVEKLIHALRIKELDVGNRFRIVQVVAAVVAFAPQCLSPVFAFAFAGRDLNVATMYESLSYMILLTSPLASLFQEIPNILAAFTCLNRIQIFLEAKPRRDFRNGIGGNQTTQPLLPEDNMTSGNQGTNVTELGSISPLTEKSAIPANEVAISIDNGCFGWTRDRLALSGIQATIRTSQITLVVGPVACGKSTLLKAILGDVPFATGEVRLHPSFSDIAFCDQVPFLASATLKQNIVRYRQFDQKRYDDVIEATALAYDIAFLQFGHDTNIGSGGTTLSGGQKARVSLARALYHGSSLLILDDVFSGLDNNTETEVFRRVFGPHGLVRRRGTTAVLCTHSIRHLPFADHIIALGIDGTIVEQGSFEMLKSNMKYIESLGLEATKHAGEVDNEISENQVKDRPQPHEGNTIQEALNDRSRQLGDFKVYKHYFSTMSKLLIFSLITSCILFAAGTNLPTVWVGYWAADSLSKSNSFYIVIFSLFSALQLIGVFAGAFTSSVLMTKGSGSELHRSALSTVMHAPLSFFTSTNTGTITNLFSQDTTIIDSQLSLYLLNSVFGVVGIFGSAFVVAIASPYLAISYPFLIGIGWTVQMFYLRTSRQLRLLDLEAKSPLYNNFLDTIKGVATIRAFGWVNNELANNRHLLDTSQRPAYLLAMIQQCLVLALNVIVTIMATILTSLATQLRVSSGFTGASLVTLMSFGQSATNLMYSYTALETSIGAVSRLKTFSDTVLPEDQPGENVIPPVGWPHNGAIELRNVSASYATDPSTSSEKPLANLALRNITLSIRAGEKVAICGRTGRQVQP